MSGSRLSTKLMNTCIASLCKARNLMKAESAIIDCVRLGVIPDVVTYNTLLDAYCRFISIDAGYSILSRMQEAGDSRHGQLLHLFDLFEEMLQIGLHLDFWSYNIVMHSFFRLGKAEEAYRLFHDIVTNFSPHHITFNILINGLYKNGYVDNALKLLRHLEQHGWKPHLDTYNILIDGLCKLGRLNGAKKIMGELIESGCSPNAITCTTIIKWCFRSRKFEESLQIFTNMKQKGYTFDAFSYCTVFGALIRIGRG
ncbi:LOW QUALITY PROTEIN: hypothetical protein V2J09_006077 [Rumex salicifolius]